MREVRFGPGHKGWVSLLFTVYLGRMGRSLEDQWQIYKASEKVQPLGRVKHSPLDKSLNQGAWCRLHSKAYLGEAQSSTRRELRENWRRGQPHGSRAAQVRGGHPLTEHICLIKHSAEDVWRAASFLSESWTQSEWLTSRIICPQLPPLTSVTGKEWTHSQIVIWLACGPQHFKAITENLGSDLLTLHMRKL